MWASRASSRLLFEYHSLSRAAPPPVPPPSLLSSSSGQPVYLPNLQHNQKSLYYVKSSKFTPFSFSLSSFLLLSLSNLTLFVVVGVATACLAGTTAGILGLTNLQGFLFFFLTTLLTGSSFTIFNCRLKPEKFFLNTRETVLSGLGEGLFSYVLFWTRKYSLFFFLQVCETEPKSFFRISSFLFIGLYLRLRLCTTCLHYFTQEEIPQLVKAKTENKRARETGQQKQVFYFHHSTTTSHARTQKQYER